MLSRSWWQSLTLLGVLACAAQGAEYGDLTGQIIFGGEAPTPEPLSITKDAEFCGKHMLVNEQLVVDPKTKGISNVLIFVKSKIADKDIHPDLLKDVEPKVVFDNKNCRFEPHVTGVWFSKQVVEFHNSDPVSHNSNISPIGQDGKNTLLQQDASVEFKFKKKTNAPTKVNCNIHPWMEGYIASLENPYFAVTDAEGKFTIKGLPVGKHEFVVWQERVGWVDTKDWPKGKFEFEVKADENNLGEIKIDPKALVKKK